MIRRIIRGLHKLQQGSMISAALDDLAHGNHQLVRVMLKGLARADPALRWHLSPRRRQSIRCADRSADRIGRPAAGGRAVMGEDVAHATHVDHAPGSSPGKQEDVDDFLTAIEPRRRAGA